MKKTIVALIIVGLVLATFSTAQAQSNEYYINLIFGPNIVYVGADQPIVLRYGWIACNDKFLEMFDRSYDHNIWMGGAYLEGGSWSGPFTYTGELLDLCIVKNGPAMWKDFNYFLGQLPPGAYQIRFQLNLKYMVLDGADANGDYKLDRYKPGTLVDRVITVVVQ